MEIRHVNTRQPGDPRPDRATCRYCRRVTERSADGIDWTGAGGRECPQAPNPDDGPMPGHEPDGVILHPPAVAVPTSSTWPPQPPPNIPAL